MATKRNKYILKHGDVIDIEEYHDGNYGAKGKKRTPKKKLTKEDMQKVNAQNKTKKCRQRLLQYFSMGDCFATWTYETKNRPPNMQEALKDFQKAVEKVRRQYGKRGKQLFWIRNIERGTKGAWHIHLVVNEIGDTASILQKAWNKGGTWFTEIRKSKFYDEDFTKLASYMTKDERTVEIKADGTPAKPRIREASYNISRNMPLPEPATEKPVRWPKEPKPKKGYYIAKMHEGINPVTGFKYRRYTLIRLGQDLEENKNRTQKFRKKRRRKRERI